MAKKLKTTRWDVTEHLEDEADMATYLQAMIDESGNDPKMIAVALGDIARARGMTQVARDAGIAREALYRALSPDGNPEFATVVKVLGALRLKFAVQPGGSTASPRIAKRSAPKVKRAQRHSEAAAEAE
jgi:probable addiction module antidote protein